MKNSNMEVLIVMTLLACVIALFSGIAIGQSSENISFKREAVKHGVAHWVLDENGHAAFEWLECK
jgi:hypothetical protein